MYKRVSVATGGNLIRELNPIIFDARDVASYQAAHLPNAIYLSDQTLKSAIKKAPRDRPILVYCYRGNASRDIAKLFCDFGFADVYSLDGGFESWHQEMPEAVHKPIPARAEADLKLSSRLEQLGFTSGGLESCRHGATSLIKACQSGRADVAAALIQAGARLDAVDDYGNDALWAACFSGDIATLEVLMDAKVDINRQNPNGSTALIYAASAGKTQVVEYLLKAGANHRLQNADGFTALDLAANVATLKLLKARR